MRILLDQHDLAWDEAWDITRAHLLYTNHTLLPEALESWPVPLFERLLPRHMQIIYLLNALHLDHAARVAPGDLRLLSSVSLIDEAHGRRVRMGHLAFLGSHRINGVSALHTRLLRETVFADMDRLYPGAHRQQDQWHHLPPLAAAVRNPGLAAACRRSQRGLSCGTTSRFLPGCVPAPKILPSANASPP